jgi:hypothetical protein
MRASDLWSTLDVFCSLAFPHTRLGILELNPRPSDYETCSSSRILPLLLPLPLPLPFPLPLLCP